MNNSITKNRMTALQFHKIKLKAQASGKFNFLFSPLSLYAFAQHIYHFFSNHLFFFLLYSLLIHATNCFHFIKLQIEDLPCLLAFNSPKTAQRNDAQNMKEKRQLIIATTLCFFFMVSTFFTLSSFTLTLNILAHFRFTISVLHFSSVFC